MVIGCCILRDKEQSDGRRRGTVIGGYPVWTSEGKKVMFRNGKETDGNSKTVRVYYHRLRERYRPRLIWYGPIRVDQPEVSKGINNTSEVSRG